ncbi:NAD(P)/FAD-dependent oxidoreductase [Marispirochaeta aestuarii]|uniref:phytoene desaturase family protein n=1 Tax=Marispirochaeta aestuarii TaxID=1963862 RepID=UPI0029C7A9B2|nr:NAD(P)/FAD-dependent oxidoreductase [Marispirochaeta aestuarii]
MERSIIIIGAGLTGLAAGCYGRMNGYKTRIFEMHTIPGGVCTAWKRKGYTIDGAVNWVLGTAPGTAFHRFWLELGAARNWQVYNHERSLDIENREGRAFTFYTDADRLEREMMEIAPEDGKLIREFTDAIRYAAGINMSVDKPEELYSIIDKLKMIRKLPMLGFMQKWSRKSVRDFVAGLKSPYLKEMLPLVFGFDAPMIMMIMMLGWQHGKLAGYLIGGALPLVESIEKRYKDLGGEVHYQARVEKILVENDTAKGIRLTDGTEHRADWIISAADGRTTIFDMLDGRYVDKKIIDRYENPKLFKPLVYVSLGVDGMVEELPASCGGLTYPLDRPLIIAGKEQKIINVRSYCFDPTLAPKGKTLLIVQYETDYDYWKNLKKEPDRYTKEKERITAEVIAGLEQRFNGITGRIEMTDVATPITWERYTGNWRGSYEGWLFDAESFTSSMKKTLPGLKKFYMAGQWVNPGGGIPTAVMSGNHTIQLICREDHRSFVSSEP